MDNNELQKYIVKKTTNEVPGVVTLSLTCADGTIPKYLPGQYINIYFKETSTPEGKAYSISSSPNEPSFTITVRAIGEFSNILTSMKCGDTLTGSLPYGFFQPEYEKTNLILLAAGIGIAPFRSMIRDEVVKNFPRKINLFHSIRNSDDALFFDEFANLAKKYKNFSLMHSVTREEKPTLPLAIQGRIDIQDVLDSIQDDVKTEFLICGSITFVRDIWRTLKKNGVSEDFIYTEAFFSH